MSGSRPNPAEQHLGDRLSALVDGELGHETRERVLAHVATCPKCKAEVDAQRRLKNVFAEVAPPPPSESFLARLQGLPGGGDPDGGGSPFGGGGLGGFPGGFPGRPGASGVFGVRRGGDASFGFDYAPGRGPGHGHAAAVPMPAESGFPIHPVSRGEAGPSRGLRFAFVAAGAVSLAAIALGGVTPGSPAATDTRAGSGSNVTPAGSPSTGAATAPESQRRRGATPLPAQSGQSTAGGTPVVPTSLSAPLLPGLPASGTVQDVARTLTTPVMAGAAAMSPLIRPLSVTAPVALTTLSPAPPATAPGVLSLSASGGPTSASASPSATSSP